MAQKNGTKNVIQTAVEWTPVHVIVPKDYESNTINSDKLKRVKSLRPKDLAPNLVIPPKEVESGWYRKDWIRFVYHPFDIDMNYPWSQLTQDFLSTTKASPSQLMPSVWRILTSLDAIEAKFKLVINIHTLCYAYTTKRFSGARITLIVRKKREPLIWNITEVHDRGWRGEYFFGERSSLESTKETTYMFDQWNSAGNIEEAQYDKEGRAVAEKIYALKPEDKISPNFTGREIPNCSHVNVEEFIKKHSKSEVKKDSTEVYRTRSNTGRTGSKAAGKRHMTSLKEGGDSLNPLVVDVTAGSGDEDDDKTEQVTSAPRGPEPTEEKTKEKPKEKSKPKENLMSASIAAATTTPTIKRTFQFKEPSSQISGKELFARKENKSGATESAKRGTGTTSFGPSIKRVRVEPDIPPLPKHSKMPPPLPDYSVHAHPITFYGDLPELLMPDVVEGYGPMTLDQINAHAIRHAFHALQANLMVAAQAKVFVRHNEELEIKAARLRHKCAQLKMERDNAILERNSTLAEYDEYA